jgi:hypothetical protein
MDPSRRSALSLAGASFATACFSQVAIAGQAQDKAQAGLRVLRAGAASISGDLRDPPKTWKFTVHGSGFKVEAAEDENLAVHVAFDKALEGDAIVIVTGSKKKINVRLYHQDRKGFSVMGDTVLPEDRLDLFKGFSFNFIVVGI